MLNSYIDNVKDSIIKSTCELISIPSVHSEIAFPNMPFGKAINNALEYTLNLGKSLGFRTKNIDGYCGYIEFGKGDEIFGIIGHLDVVPADTTDWSFSPFDATVSDGKIFGRGAIDDKGPVIASLYAMKAVMDTCRVNKRVRLILGTNEERDWKCMDYYKAHEEIPTISFSPDADFPCIYAEKGLLTVYLQQPYITASPISIKSINYYDNAINVVPKQCDILLEVDNTIDINVFLSEIKNLIPKNTQIEANAISNNLISLKSYGVSAHAAHPDLGINAISQVIVLLYDIFSKYNIHIDIIDFFCNYIGTDYTGKKLSINFEDESGILTLNTAQFNLENDMLKLGFNLRIPINTSISSIKEVFDKTISKTNITSSYCGEKEALFVPKNDYLVKTLCSIYNEYYSTNVEPIAIGGATYARAFPNCISFGANLPGNKDMCHQTDEYIEINNLISACKIYAKAIYELAKYDCYNCSST